MDGDLTIIITFLYIALFAVMGFVIGDAFIPDEASNVQQETVTWNSIE